MSDETAWGNEIERALNKRTFEGLASAPEELIEHPPTVAVVLGACGASVSFWCPWCRRRRFHGAPGGKGAGHRVAHCFREESSTP